jgi:outer membrane protein assembly factor BamB
MNVRHPIPAVFLISSLVLSTLSLSARAQDDGTSWLIYKGNAQRTGVANVKLGGVPNLMWRYSSDIAPREYDTMPLVVGPASQRRIYFGVDKFVICLDAQTGAQVWRSKALQRPITSPIALTSSAAGDLILAVTSSGQLNALRTSDGGQAWQVASAAPVQRIAPVQIKTPGGDRIILALATGKLVAFTLDGQSDPAWQVTLGSFSATPTATPAISTDGTLLYIPTQDKKLYVVDIAGAKVSYPINLDTAAFTSPLILGNRLVLVTGTTLQSLKLATGQNQWRFDEKSDLSAASGVTTGKGEEGTVYLGARNGKFYAVNLASGAITWQTNLGDAVTGVPTVLQDMVLVGTRNGLLFGLAPDSGKVLWRYRLHTQRTTGGRDRGDDGGGGRRRGPRGDAAGVAPTSGGDGFGNPGFGNPGDAPNSGGPGTGRGGDASDNNAPIVRVMTYGVSSMPAVVGDSVYVLGDNAALYAFSTQPFDADPPQLVNPLLSIPNSAGKQTLMRLDADKSLLVPGRAPIQFVAELDDAGSGVDPDSIRVSLNKQELPKGAITSFSDVTGRLIVSLIEAKGRVSANLEDGLFNIIVNARDYRGNETNFSGNFLVDNTVTAPAAAPPRARGDDDNGR